MEEILASIRKIIAEDTSGSRTVPPPAPSRASQSPVRPNAGVRPAAPQQRGFMSREAFMKSSAPADEPGEQRFFTPVTPPQDPVTPESASKSASGVSAAKAAPAPVSAAVKVEPKSVETQAAVAIKSSEPEKTQAPSIKPEQEKPADASIAAEVQAIVEAEHKSATVETSSEAQLIDAQLVELLGEDLKALREADERQDWKNTPTLDAAARVAPAPAVAAPKPAEPAVKVNGAAASIVSPPAAARVETPETPTVADPFAFDLGPSPFLPRALNEKPAEQQISIDPPQAPLRASVPQQPDSRPSPAAQGWPKANGSPVVQETARPVPASAPRAAEPQPAPATARPQTFAVPSVSATLGPHRTLEPLSDSFKPAAPAHSKPAEPEADPFPFRALPRSVETPAEPARPPLDNRLQPAHVPPLSALPPLDVEAEPVIGGDRTMEDAVADLLRPLLKTWLAENMPKIVERALRREMTERLLPGHKNSRD
jgi:cell pole-organizing protein PopZ